MSESNGDENPLKDYHRLTLSHQHDLEIEDILLKLQQVTKDSAIPESLPQEVEFPATLSDSERDKFFNSHLIQ